MAAIPVREIQLPVGRCSYRTEGEAGPLLLQIHGLGTGHKNFDLLTPHLATRLRVIDVDLPGYGSSTPLDRRSASIEGHAEQVGTFIEALEIGPVHLHGTSMGGLVAMTLAADRPELVRSLVVTCSFARLDNAMRAMQRSWRSAAKSGPRMLAEVTSVQGFSRGFWDRPDASEIQDAFVAALESSSTDDFVRDLPLMEHLDLGQTVKRITTTTLLLGAAEDQMTPVQAAPSGLGMTDLSALIPNSTLRVLEGCGHFISIERGAETAREIVEFVFSRERTET